VTMPDLSDPAIFKLLDDPFYIRDQPGLTQSSGWLDAWRSAPSAYVVAAETAGELLRRSASRRLTMFVSL